jgi:methanogenic corrinoid protein MtbC1
MLIWCSYCQQFVGEGPPYERLAVTHGVCSSCEPSVLSLTETEFSHALRLKAIQEQLADAGRNNDLTAAARIIASAGKANVSGVDILLGVIAPILYQIGEDWKCGTITVAQEHRFTAFYESIYHLVAAGTTNVLHSDASQAERPDVLLTNAPGNRHTLAIRILALWLARKGARTQVATGPLDVEGMIALVGKTQPHILLVSMALAEQAADVATIAGRIAALRDDIRPRVIVGGYAVKLGMVSAISGATLMADISSLAVFGTGLSCTRP